MKQKHTFKLLAFDINKFYAFIKEALLKKALDFVEAYTVISTDEKSIINHAKKSSLFSNEEAWVKEKANCLIF